jgi:aminoglycoside phosphotransferase (APT) family kinase protein
MMRALAMRGIPTPQVIGLETDRGVLGGQFLVTAQIDGHGLPQHPSYHMAGLLHDLPAASRHALWCDAIRQVGSINRLNWQDGFAFLNRPAFGPPGLDQYLGWLAAWARQATSDHAHPVLDYALNYLRANKPKNDLAADVIWGDSNVGNMLFTWHGSVAAVLDFEAAAVGPGEIDLGWWFYMDDMLSHGVPRLEGLPSRQQQISIYEETLGRKVQDLDFYEILAGVRMALVMVRIVERLVNLAILPTTTRAASVNPIVQVLASRLGLACEPTGADYMAMVTAMNAR